MQWRTPAQSGLGVSPHKRVVMSALCLAGVLLNITLNRVIIRAGLPLYLDTVFTISATLVGGLFWGSLCGALTNLIGNSVWFGGWEAYLFALCNIATAVITWLFIRFFPRELKSGYSESSGVRPAVRSDRLSLVMDRMIALILLSFALCLGMSILGGFIAGLIQIFDPSHTGKWGIPSLLTPSMFSENFPLILSEILLRIPVNIIDRLISAFGGYGVAVVIGKLSKEQG